MQIVNHSSFKKLTVSLLSIIFHFHVYLNSRWQCASKKPKTQQNPIKPKKPPGLGFFLKTRVFLNPVKKHTTSMTLAKKHTDRDLLGNIKTPPQKKLAPQM